MSVRWTPWQYWAVDVRIMAFIGILALALILAGYLFVGELMDGRAAPRIALESELDFRVEAPPPQATGFGIFARGDDQRVQWEMKAKETGDCVFDFRWTEKHWQRDRRTPKRVTCALCALPFDAPNCSIVRDPLSDEIEVDSDDPDFAARVGPEVQRQLKESPQGSSQISVRFFRSWMLVESQTLRPHHFPDRLRWAQALRDTVVSAG